MAGNDMIKVSTKKVKVDYRSKKRPFDVNLNGNRASITFTSGPEETKSNSKWAMGMVCVPKTEYKTVCEVCESIQEEMKNGPENDEVIKVLERKL